MTVLHIEHRVRDYERWKAAFDSDPLDRKGSEVRRYRIARAVDNPAFVMVDLEFDTTAKAEQMLACLQDLWPRRMGVLIDEPKGRVFDVAEARELWAVPGGQHAGNSEIGAHQANRVQSETGGGAS